MSMLAVIPRVMEFFAILGILFTISILICIIISICGGAKDKSSKNEDKYENLLKDLIFIINDKGNALKSISPKEYYNRLEKITTSSLGTWNSISVCESKYGLGWFVKIINKESGKTYYPAIDIEHGDPHKPYRYLSSCEAEDLKNKLLDSQLNKLVKIYRLEIDRLTIWED